MEPPLTLIGALGFETWHEGGVTHGRLNVAPWTLGPSGGLRIGLLSILVDIVVGTPPTGPITPTVDLAVRYLRRPPSSGLVSAVCRPAKIGRRLFVGEAPVYAGEDPRPLAHSTVTFLNESMPGIPTFGPRPARWHGDPDSVPSSVDEMLGARAVSPGVIELDAGPRVNNGPGGTVQGGIQALVAELAAESLLAGEGPATVTDLSIRYLNRVAVGPLRATAEVLVGDTDDISVRVALTDPGHGDRLVGAVLTVARRYRPS